MGDKAARFGDLEVGAIVAKAGLRVAREDLVRYAGASVDLSPIQFSDAVAASAGLPGVLAHGMLTAVWTICRGRECHRAATK